MTPDKPNHGPSAFELLARFTDLRESGTNRDDAWFQVCDSVGCLPHVTYKAFLNLVKNWERREGHKYRYHNRDAGRAIDDTLTSQPPDLKAYLALLSQTQPEPDPSPATQTPVGVTAAPAPADVLALPRLHFQAQRREQILDQMDDLPDEAVPAPMPYRETPHPTIRPGRTARIGYAPGYFGPRTVLLMYFNSSPTPLRVTFAGEADLVIGRATANSAMAPEIDLNRVNGVEYGVSRMHATLTCRNDQLLIADLESMNFTYINGVRLLPHEAHALRDGDEIWFGQLRCRIRFQQL